MARPTRPPANAFVFQLRKVYNPIGFSHGYNFVLFVIFFGALLGFSLSRLMYLDFDGVFCAASEPAALPSECFFYKNNVEKFGIILHLVAILPGSILACWQFVPAIRHKAIILHRINGYIVILLSLASTAGVLMITRHAAGGSLETQAGLGLLSIMFVASLLLAFINIKRLQIEQHRAWMLRAWFYAGSIITLRLIQIVSAILLSSIGKFQAARRCDLLEYLVEDVNKTRELYPACEPYFLGQNVNQHAVVDADFTHPSSAAEAAVALEISFGMALWIALAVHAVGVEIYLHLTPAEANRIRHFSYKRQLEAGMKHPGRAGITSDRIGDAVIWNPEDKNQHPKSKGGLEAAQA
ncbi:hypothetical protein B0T25DRAFT_132370 [Lasiosphaeria hispida]|uniref:Microtubule associated protein n=1 Tax=Lasiosphaeria hispida TaxID=260671 RepID=A0AAJ0HSX1_9PEZI|nr:hypothetical protein B0T25DRAFT_132370 [Lasiosphaeria hispida]